MSMRHTPPPPFGQVPPPPGDGPQPGHPVPPPATAGGWSATLIVGIVAAAVGFAEISFSSSRTVNGVVVECSYVNLAPWLFGPVALVCGVVGLARLGRTPMTAGRDKVLGVVCVVLGAVHLLRAFGVLELVSSSPC